MLTKSLSIIYQKFCLTEEVPVCCKLANVMGISKKSLKGCREWQTSATEGHGAAWVPWHGVYRTARKLSRLGPASMCSWKADPLWLTCSPSMTRWTTWWGREKLQGVVYPDFRFWHLFPEHFPGEPGHSWLGQMYSFLVKNLAGWPGPGSWGEWK